ncbi:DUF3231 family protein [Cytobacillus sp. FSL K6-0129]|uniref:DUF3231 family protein n=1 Tax=Cytobacillus sp. FSL K6-0129 TaxID=2921421 RepID=UPI0030F5F388
MAEKDQRLTASELAQLWNAYMNNKMYKCVLQYFYEKADKGEIKEFIETAIEMCDEIIFDITTIYNKNNHPLPKAFSEEEDVNVTAPKLYSDVFILAYMHDMTRYGIIGYGTALAIAIHEDVDQVFTKALEKGSQLYRWAIKLQQEKGVFHPSPSIPIPEKIEIAEKNSYLNGFISEQRALSVVEIMNVYNDMQRNALGKALFLGLCQTVTSNDIKKFLRKGLDLFDENVQEFANTLIKDSISVSPTWDSEVLNSTTPPFSEKLMLYQVVIFIATLSGYYGTALGTTTRRDLTVMYAKIMTETLDLGNQSASLLIKYGWLEQAPQSVDHRNISKKKRK